MKNLKPNIKFLLQRIPESLHLSSLLLISLRQCSQLLNSIINPFRRQGTSMPNFIRIHNEMCKVQTNMFEFIFIDFCSVWRTHNPQSDIY